MSPSKIQVSEAAAEARAQAIMAKSIEDQGTISIRLNAQVKDTEKGSYVGLPGQSITFKAKSPAMVEKAFDAIEEALKKL